MVWTWPGEAGARTSGNNTAQSRDMAFPPVASADGSQTAPGTNRPGAVPPQEVGTPEQATREGGASRPPRARGRSALAGRVLGARRVDDLQRQQVGAVVLPPGQLGRQRRQVLRLGEGGVLQPAGRLEHLELVPL